jgi:hypothetical protein
MLHITYGRQEERPEDEPRPLHVLHRVIAGDRCELAYRYGPSWES